MPIPKHAVQMATLVVVALVIATGCSGQKPLTEIQEAVLEARSRPPILVAPNAGVDVLEKGMNRQQAEAAMGKPEKIDGTNGQFWYYPSRGLNVVFGNDGLLLIIRCVPPFAGVTKQGIGIGSTRAELLAAYGNPTTERHSQGSAGGGAASASAGPIDAWWFTSLRMNFVLQNDKVRSFGVYLDAK
jgi:hypothetical protein